MKLEHFDCDCTAPPTIEKLRSKDVAMYAYGISIYYAYIGSQMDLGGAIRNERYYRANVESCP